MLECRNDLLSRLLELVDLSEEEEVMNEGGALLLHFLADNVLLSAADFAEEEELVEEVDDLGGWWLWWCNRQGRVGVDILESLYSTRHIVFRPYYLLKSSP